jgi:hypothetical protein
MMVTGKGTFPFPFGMDSAGRISAIGGDDAIRAKIIQVLFTAPGERVNLPEFGCGLLNLVFEPNAGILAAAMEFTISQALNRWLSSDITVDGVGVDSDDEFVSAEIVYTKKQDLGRQTVRIRFR